MEKQLVKQLQSHLDPLDENVRTEIALNRLFNNNDQLKTNTALQMKAAEIELKMV